MKAEIYNELESIRLKSDGFIRPKDVVDYARDPNTALHSHFTWDDSAAAEKYRLAEARAIIRVSIIVHESTSEKVRAFVSLSTNRHPNGGYRAFAEIIENETDTEIMLRDAINELASFKRKYEALKEIAEFEGIFVEIDRVSTRKDISPVEHRANA